jgi:hypothetical protein
MVFDGVIPGVSEFGAGASPVGVGQEIFGGISLVGFGAGAVDGEPDPQLGVYDEYATGGRVVLGRGIRSPPHAGG